MTEFEVEAYLEQVVSRIRTSVSPAGSGGDPKCPALDLGPLLLRLPGETWILRGEMDGDV